MISAINIPPQVVVFQGSRSPPGTSLPIGERRGWENPLLRELNLNYGFAVSLANKRAVGASIGRVFDDALDDGGKVFEVRCEGTDCAARPWQCGIL